MKREDFNTYHEYLNASLDVRHVALIERVNRYVTKSRNVIPTLIEDHDKQWLKQFTIGTGLDVACGDFPLAVGVDKRYASVGADFFAEGDDLHFQESNTLDFIVSNWFDVFPNTIKVLEEWYRCLKPDATLALVCRDVEAYNTAGGPLESRHRQSLYSKKILSMYLHRVGFKNIHIEEVASTKALRVKAVK